MKHSLDDVAIVFYEGDDAQSKVVVSKKDRIKAMFTNVFSNLNDRNGSIIGEKAVFKDSFLSTIIKCDIENSMDLIYNMLEKHIETKDMAYYRDDMDAEPSKEILKVVELIHHLHSHRIPRKYVAGFLLLMVRFIYFPLNN